MPFLIPVFKKTNEGIILIGRHELMNTYFLKSDDRIPPVPRIRVRKHGVFYGGNGNGNKFIKKKDFKEALEAHPPTF